MKILFFTFIIFIFISKITAQSSFGFKGGYNASWMDFEKKNIRQGYHAGAFIRVPIKEKLTFQSEALISTKGVVLKEYLYPVDLSFSLNYLSIPTLLNFNINK